MASRSGRARRVGYEKWNAVFDGNSLDLRGFPLGRLVKRGELQVDDLVVLRMAAPFEPPLDDLKNWKAACSICW